MNDVVTELVFCREEPIFKQFGDFFVVYVKRDVSLTKIHSERLKLIGNMFTERIDDLVITAIDSEWELPASPHSKTIKYRGIPLRYSPVRFGVMKAIILAQGQPATYENLCLHGWGNGERMVSVDPEVIGHAVYHINLYHRTNGIPVSVHFVNQEHAFFGPGTSGKKVKSVKNKLKQKKATS
jgi:hypothetical protein